ncbi:MAG: DNRLRE domain-containing protein [Gammaproteobacteria bacterium]|nr:DNRLRE domain-containing protein [Gammaproteobacteria bacterium]
MNDAPAAALSFQQGVDHGFGVYTGARDTRLIFGVNGNTNYGDNASGGIDGGSSAQHWLLGFDDILGAGPGRIAPGSTILAATLSVTVFNSGGSGRVHRMVSDWDEALATWNNFMLAGNLTAGLQADDLEARSVQSASLPGAGVASADVTADVQAWADGAAAFGWGFIATSSDGTFWHSSDYGVPAQRPRLTVEFTAPVPLPPAALLLAGGLLVLPRRGFAGHRPGIGSRPHLPDGRGDGRHSSPH